MIDFCVDGLNCIILSFNVKKKVVLYAVELDICAFVNQSQCTTISLHVHKARYLGVTLCSGECFGVDMRSSKSNFYSSFNSICHTAASNRNKLVALHIVAAYCKPYLLYSSESMELNAAQMRRRGPIKHTWQTGNHIIFILMVLMFEMHVIMLGPNDVPLDSILL